MFIATGCDIAVIMLRRTRSKAGAMLSLCWIIAIPTHPLCQATAFMRDETTRLRFALSRSVL